MAAYGKQKPKNRQRVVQALMKQFAALRKDYLETRDDARTLREAQAAEVRKLEGLYKSDLSEIVRRQSVLRTAHKQALEQVKADFAKRLDPTETRLKNLKFQLEQVEGAIKTFESDWSRSEVPAPAHPRVLPFKKGEFPGAAIRLLALSPEPLSVDDLTLRTFDDLGLKRPEQRVFRAGVLSVDHALHRHAGIGLATRDPTTGLWRITRPQSQASAQT